MMSNDYHHGSSLELKKGYKYKNKIKGLHSLKYER